MIIRKCFILYRSEVSVEDERAWQACTQLRPSYRNLDKTTFSGSENDIATTRRNAQFSCKLSSKQIINRTLACFCSRFKGEVLWKRLRASGIAVSNRHSMLNSGCPNRHANHYSKPSWITAHVLL